MNVFDGFEGLEKLIFGPNIQSFVPRADAEKDEYLLFDVS